MKTLVAQKQGGLDDYEGYYVQEVGSRAPGRPHEPVGDVSGWWPGCVRGYSCEIPGEVEVSTGVRNDLEIQLTVHRILEIQCEILAGDHMVWTIEVKDI